jgi:hypothetical protein
MVRGTVEETLNAMLEAEALRRTSFMELDVTSAARLGRISGNSQAGRFNQAGRRSEYLPGGKRPTSRSYYGP